MNKWRFISFLSFCSASVPGRRFFLIVNIWTLYADVFLPRILWIHAHVPHTNTEDSESKMNFSKYNTKTIKEYLQTQNYQDIFMIKIIS